jgi:hypothetical protein
VRIATKQHLDVDGKPVIGWTIPGWGYDPTLQAIIDKAGKDCTRIAVTYHADGNNWKSSGTCEKGEIPPRVIPKPDPIPEPPKEGGLGEAGVGP